MHSLQYIMKELFEARVEMALKRALRGDNEYIEVKEKIRHID